MESKIIDKLGALVLRNESFLVVRKKGTKLFLMPGGKREFMESDTEALAREIQEELGVPLDTENLAFVGVFEDEAAYDPGKVVRIRLYKCEIKGEPTPSSEIEEIWWFNAFQDDESKLTAIIKRKILPAIRKMLTEKT